MNSPLITIIIPVYNVKKYLPACFESVKNQTYQNLEIILVDDGSTDGSGKLCDEYKKQDPRVRVIHQQNQGLSAARNAGIKKATGEYLNFVDSDDTISPDCIEYLYHLIKKYHTKLSICSVTEISERGKTNNRGAGYPEAKLSQVECLDRMLCSRGFNVSAYAKLYAAPLFSTAKLYANQLFTSVRFPIGALHEDLGTTYKLIMQCDQIAYGPSSKYQYYQRAGSITHSKFTDRKFAIIDFTDEMCAAIDAVHPELKNSTNRRRMHARFSVLRLMVGSKNLTKSQQAKMQEIITYLRRHKHFITNNPKATRRDKAAIAALLVSPRAFKLSWQAYAKLRK